jgi:hypothetical protein
MFTGLTTVGQGKIGLAYAIPALVEAGYHISIPLIDDCPYDLVADDGKKLHRVQVKSTRSKPYGSYYTVQLKHVHHNSSGNTIRPFDASLADLLVCVCEDKSVFIIPTTELNVTMSLTLNEKYAKYRTS